MVRRKLLALLSVAGAGALAACVPQPVYIPQPGYVPPAMATGCDTRFQVVNQSSRAIYSLQYSHASRSDWGVDQLGQNMIPSGGVWNARASNAGAYDFRITWNGGGAAELRNINICSASQIVVTNRGMYAR